MTTLDDEVRFGVLGALDVARGGRSVLVAAEKQRIVLSTLLLNVNKFVSHDHLVDRIWSGDAPVMPRGALHTHVSRLRRVLGDDHHGEGQLIRSRRDGYSMSLPSDALDLLRFRELTTRAAAASSAADEAELLGRSLTLWRGTALADVPSELLQHDDVPLLTEERLRATERLLDLRLQLGRHEEAVAPLKALTAEYPFRERLWAQLMAALFLSGRRAESLEAYRNAASLLREELGIDPSQELERLHGDILADDLMSVRLLNDAQTAPVQAKEGLHISEPVFRAAAVEPPQQLPSDLAHFAGRAKQVEQLDALLAEDGREPIVIAAITGMGGIGKTALAVHWAHRVIDRFPGGVLYLDLQGFGASRPLEPADGLEMLLHALGVSAARIPAQSDARSALLRTVLGGRRVLLLLDNARDAAQVRPLLPGSHAFVLITSRNRLRGMAAREGAHRIELEPFSAVESTALLSMILGPDLVDAEPAASAEVAHLCAHLPLALMIAAEHATTVGSEASLSRLAQRMRDRRTRLDLLDGIDDHEACLRAVLSWSYDALHPAASHLLRLLSLHPGTEFGTPVAAAVANVGHREARGLLELLADRSLLQRVDEDRYRFHDLIHAYASRQSEEHDGQAERVTALRRILDFYLYTSGRAADQLEPSRRRFPLGIVHVPTEPLTFTQPGKALVWLQEQRANLRAAVTCAAEHGLDGLTWQLPHVLWRYFLISEHPHDWIDTHRLALPAARNSADPRAAAEILKNLGFAYWRCGHLSKAHEYHLQALALDQSTHDHWGEAKTRNHLGFIYDRAGLPPQALEQHKRSLALYEKSEDLCGQGRALIGIGNADWQLGNHATAANRLRIALRIARDLGDRWGESLALISIGLTLLTSGRNGQAMEQLQTALRVSRETGDDWGQSQALIAIGFTHLADEHPSEALERLHAALRIADDTGDRWSQGLAHITIGIAHLTAGRRDQATTHLSQALATGSTERLPQISSPDEAVEHLRAAITNGVRPHLLALQFHHDGTLTACTDAVVTRQNGARAAKARHAMLEIPTKGGVTCETEEAE